MNLRYLINSAKIVNGVYQRYKQPQLREFLQSVRYPQHPNIVVFGINPLVEKVWNTEELQYIKTENSNQSDEQEVIAIAQKIHNPESTFEGNLIQNFPKNKKQAYLLDKALDGINLAIQFKFSPNLNVKQEENAQESEVINYYKEKGTLLQIEINEELLSKPNYVAQEEIFEKIAQNIKD